MNYLTSYWSAWSNQWWGWTTTGIFQGLIAAGVVAACLWLARTRLSPRMQYAVLWLLLLKLALPPFPGLGFFTAANALHSTFPHAQVTLTEPASAPTATLTEQSVDDRSATTTATLGQTPPQVHASAVASSPPKMRWPAIAAVCHLFGFFVVLSFAIFRTTYFVHRATRNQSVKPIRPWLDVLAELRRDFDVRAVSLVNTDVAEVPLVCGLLRPRIYFPTWLNDLPPAKRRAVLAHETRACATTRSCSRVVAIVTCIMAVVEPPGLDCREEVNKCA